MDSVVGKERYRIEGYLPKEEFRPELEFVLARLAFDAKKWFEAEAQYRSVLERYPTSAVAPAAQYWTGVRRISERMSMQFSDKLPMR